MDQGYAEELAEHCKAKRLAQVWKSVIILNPKPETLNPKPLNRWMELVTNPNPKL